MTDQPSNPTKKSTDQTTRREKKLDASILENRESIQQVDKDNVLGSIEALADQIHQTWEEIQKINLDYPTIENVVIAGMGGSGLGPDIVKHLFKDELKVPLEVVNSYSVPAYVNQKSLVILSSYSGNTEEVLSCGQQAQQQSAQVAVITSGGKLAQLAKEKDYPVYLIDPKHNPSQQPRMAIGYAIIGMIGLLNQAGVITINQADIKQATQAVITTNEDCRVEVNADSNPAKTLAFMAVDRRPTLIAAEFLQGAVHTATNQMNENAKTLADYKIIPEINHHLLEGLKLPRSNKLDNLFLFFNSKLYHERNQRRITLTQKAVEKQDIQTLAVNLHAQTKIGQVFELVTLMAYVGFYLAVLHQINPSLIPTVDWFKQELAKEI